MGSWGYKAFENDTALDTMYCFSKEKNLNLFDRVRHILQDKENKREHDIVLAMALVDASINGPDKKIFCGNGDHFYGYTDFLQLGNLPNMKSLINDAICAGIYLLKIEDNLTWSYTSARKAVIEQIMLKLLLKKEDYIITSNDVDLHDINDLVSLI